jgi:hypothetical protein
MDFGSPVAQNVQAPNFTSTLSGLQGLQQQQLGIQQAQQNLQRGAAQTQMTQQDAQQRAAISKVDWSKYTDDTGTLSTDKMLSDPQLRASAGDSMLDVVKAGAGIRQAQLQNKQSLVGLNNGLRDQFGSMVGALRSDPDVIADNPAGRQKVEQAIGQFGQAGGPDAQRVAAIYGPIVEHAPQGKLAWGLNTVQLQAMDASRQAAAQQPAYANTGGTLQQTNPQAAGAPASIATTLPPTTGTMVSDGTQGVIGSPQAHFEGIQGPGRAAALAAIASGDEDQRNRQEAANVLANRPQGFVPQSMAAGQAQNISNNVEEMNRHFSSLQDQSAGTQLVSGLTGNIKALADTAATGVGGDKKAYVSGLLNAFGLGDKATGDLQKDTDLLSKNMAQLNLGTPAGTDAARALVEAGRPSTKMSAPAIKDAADQVASQVQANMAMRNMLSPAKQMGDTQTYNAQRQKLEQIADPRAWQYVNLGPGSPAAKDFMSKLQPGDRASLIQKVDQLEQMGMLK